MRGAPVWETTTPSVLRPTSTGIFPVLMTSRDLTGTYRNLTPTEPPVQREPDDGHPRVKRARPLRGR